MSYPYASYGYTQSTSNAMRGLETRAPRTPQQVAPLPSTMRSAAAGSPPDLRPRVSDLRAMQVQGFFPNPYPEEDLHVRHKALKVKAQQMPKYTTWLFFAEASSTDPVLPNDGERPFPPDDLGQTPISQDGRPFNARDSFTRHGMSSEEAGKAVLAYHRFGLHLSASTISSFNEHNLVGQLHDRQDDGACVRYRGKYLINGKRRDYVVTDFRRQDEYDQSDDAYSAKMMDTVAAQQVGIRESQRMFEVRNLLASLLAQQLGWTLVPEMHIGTAMINGELRPVLVTPASNAQDLGNHPGYHSRDMQASPQLRTDLARLDLFALICGAMERFQSPLGAVVEPLSSSGKTDGRIKVSDFTHAFGATAFYANLPMLATPLNRYTDPVSEAIAKWASNPVPTGTPHLELPLPRTIPKQVREEILKKLSVTRAVAAARELGLPEQEVSALEARIKAVRQHVRNLDKLQH